jgi:O-acetyl-ADP-ribose deacetylase (regulator of RNase III)
MGMRAERGDIVTLNVEAIVNAANEELMGGSGVDGAIHEAAGPGLVEACSQLGTCPPGGVRITPAFRIPVRWIIHTVGPVWRGGDKGEAAILASCYERSLRLADCYDIRSIGFPSISTGVFGYPPDRAAEIAVTTVGLVLPRLATDLDVVFCCFTDKDLMRYRVRIG